MVNIYLIPYICVGNIDYSWDVTLILITQKHLLKKFNG